MAISLRASGTWAEYTTDLQTVAIPGTPAAGDRMYLWVQWKDFAITLATPSGWTPILNSFADGSVSSGNGTGSISQAVFFRNWQSGDTAPTLDFSTTTGLLAEAVIEVWQKGGSDVWGSVASVTAAWPNQSTGTQDASSTINVGTGGVVFCGIGIRDDSATFTRPTTAIRDSGGLITWNGNYVESPATHYSTTTGNDHSGDLGHRLVTTGANGVTLQAEITSLSATETGSVVWVVQNLASTQTYTPALIDQTAATFAPTVVNVNTYAPALINQAAATFTPTITTTASIIVGQISQTASAFTPSAIQQQFYTPARIDQTAVTSAPTISTTYAISVGLVDQTAVAHDPTIGTSGAAPVWTTPANGVAMPPNPELKFTIPTMGSPMHFNLQLDTVNTFDSGNLRDVRSDLDQTNWAYWDGDSWEPVPSGGVDESFAGNEARYTVSPDLSSTTWYRRVRAGTS